MSSIRLIEDSLSLALPYRPNTVVLGLDPSTTHFGFAFVRAADAHPLHTGVLTFKSGDKRNERFSQISKLLSLLDESLGDNPVAVEIALHHRGVHAAHCAGGAQALILLAFDDLHAVPVQTVKAVACKGGATKGDILAAVTQRWPELPDLSDHEADAIFVAVAHIEGRSKVWCP